MHKRNVHVTQINATDISCALLSRTISQLIADKIASVLVSYIRRSFHLRFCADIVYYCSIYHGIATPISAGHAAHTKEASTCPRDEQTHTQTSPCSLAFPSRAPARPSLDTSTESSTHTLYSE